MRRYVQQGEMSPKGFAVAWMDYPWNRAVAYPIGLHVVIKMARRLWFHFVVYQPTWMEKERAIMYQQGLKDGRDQTFRMILDNLDRRR